MADFKLRTFKAWALYRAGSSFPDVVVSQNRHRKGPIMRQIGYVKATLTLSLDMPKPRSRPNKTNR